MIQTARDRGSLTIAPITEADRETIYRIRHDVYARELGQHDCTPDRLLRDRLDAFNVYIKAVVDGRIVGFVSITPPGHDAYSIDKYLTRSQNPISFDERTYEVRVLTVVSPTRGSPVASALAYASLRWIEEAGGTRIIAMGRKEIMGFYRKMGLQPLGLNVRAGNVDFEYMTALTSELNDRLSRHRSLLDRLERSVEWGFGFSFRRTVPCLHGGAFFDAIGTEFDDMNRRHRIINADVLDAWFPPAPAVLDAIGSSLSWLMRTSPPTACDGMARVIARVRGVSAGSILPGAGSSDLIYLAMREFVRPASRVLLLDPTYGEYEHVLANVIRCDLHRFLLRRDENYDIDVPRLDSALQNGYDMVVLVNPNSPTGRHLPRATLTDLLDRVPERTLVWIDETYVEYVGVHESLESYASERSNVIVCKSMSKAYALSGVRAAYLCASGGIIDRLRGLAPPWAVSLPGQVAAVRALENPDYYQGRYRETAELRLGLFKELDRRTDLEVIPGVANFLMCHSPEEGPDAQTIVRQCRERGLYLRDVSSMGSSLGSRAFRIAVKDGATNRKMIKILLSVLRTATPMYSTP